MIKNGSSATNHNIEFSKVDSTNINLKYSGTSLYGHPLNTDTWILRTVLFILTKSSYIFSKLTR